MSDWFYAAIVALPLACFFVRLTLTNHLVPFIKKRALRTCLSQRSDWPVLVATETALSQLFQWDFAKITANVSNLPSAL